MFRNGAWCDFVLAVALARCSILFCREGCKITSPNPFPFLIADPFPRSVDNARETEPDQGYFPLEDSRIKDGCPNILST